MGLSEKGFLKAGHTTMLVPPMLDLPPPETKRWVPRRKAQVVAAVRAGALSLDEACERQIRPSRPAHDTCAGIPHRAGATGKTAVVSQNSALPCRALRGLGWD